MSSLGIPEQKIQVIHCGVKLNPDSRHRKKHSGEKIRLGCLGRFVEKKGIDLLLEAAKIVKDKGYDIKLDIAGYGPLEERYKTYVRDHGLKGCVSFPGKLTHKDVFRWLENIDLFVLPCRRDNNGDVDGIPVVLMEAMANGVPVISSKLSGITELIDDGISGLLVEPDDSDSIAIRIIDLIENGDLFETLQKNAYKKIDSDFTLSKCAMDIGNIIRGTINNE